VVLESTVLGIPHRGNTTRFINHETLLASYSGSSPSNNGRLVQRLAFRFSSGFLWVYAWRLASGLNSLRAHSIVKKLCLMCIMVLFMRFMIVLSLLFVFSDSGYSLSSVSIPERPKSLMWTFVGGERVLANVGGFSPIFDVCNFFLIFS